MILTDETKIKVLHDGLEKVVTLAELKEYFRKTFTEKRSVITKRSKKHDEIGDGTASWWKEKVQDEKNS